MNGLFGRGVETTFDMTIRIIEIFLMELPGCPIPPSCSGPAGAGGGAALDAFVPVPGEQPTSE